MERVTVSKFTNSCLSFLEQVKKTGQPVLVTKNGKPIALLSAAEQSKKNARPFGCMKKTITVKGDIISPVAEAAWEVLSR